jgi:glucose/arabinose dehydrogenase
MARAGAQHDAVKTGITSVSSGLLCILAAVHGDTARPRLDVPHGFTASVYARGITGARDLTLLPDGTLTLTSGGQRYEIAPPTADSPATLMRVAAELDRATGTDPATLATRAPRFVEMRWNAASGELAYSVNPGTGVRVDVPGPTLAFARRLARRHAEVALAPDGSLFVADARAGAVWRVRRGP